MKVLTKTSDLTRAEWLHYRTQGIGGSDVSVIAGINPYRSAHQLWLEKTGRVEPEESQNDYTHFGTILEPIVKREFTARTGLKVRAKKMLLQSSEHPFMLADLDGVIYENGEMCIFEAKTASAYKQDVWEEGVPPEYVMQIQHYMAVTGAKKTYIAALVGGNHFYSHEIQRDDEMIEKIIAMEAYFWEHYVIGGIEPVPDGSSATTAYFNSRYSHSNGGTVQLPPEALSIFAQYDELSRQLEELKTAKDAVTNQLKSYLKENEVGTVGDRQVTWKQITKTSFDSKRLKAEKPEIYGNYVVESQYRRLSVA
jgi:putative phage-type endonuclease